MKYENMPKGRNKDICVRCGKRANFADRLKSDIQYDLLCLAETTSSGYMTHGNVKLCGKCMSELLMWLDADDFCSYGERGADTPQTEAPRQMRTFSEGGIGYAPQTETPKCEHITEDGVTCAKYPACDGCIDNPLSKVKGSERLVKGSERTDCQTCKWWSSYGYCVYRECKCYEPQTDCGWK